MVFRTGILSVKSMTKKLDLCQKDAL